MADSEKEKLFQKHSQRVQEQVDAIVKQKERIRKQEEADRAFSEKVAKAGGWGGMASGQKMRLLETSLWKMQEDLIDRVEQAQRDLVDMDYIRKIWKIRDKAKNSTSVRNAKFKVGDKVRIANPHVMGRGRVGEIYDTNVDGSPREYLVKFGAEIEEWSESDLAKFEYNTNIATANSVRSTNIVVVKALNSVGYNPSDKQDWSIHSVTAHGTWIKKRVHDMTLREAIAEAKKDASKYKYEKVTIYDTVTGKSRHEEKIANSKVAMNASPEASIRAEFNRLSAKGEQLNKEYRNITNELRKIKTDLKILELDAKKFDLRKLEDEIFRTRITYTMC